VQYQNALWGFQLAWYLVLVTAALTIYLLDRWVLTWPVVVIAIMSSVITSLSSLQGLLIWPIGLLLMFDRRRPLPFKIVWIVAAALTAVVYFANFNRPRPDLRSTRSSTLSTPPSSIWSWWATWSVPT
jgi:hypothetical protein